VFRPFDGTNGFTINGLAEEDDTGAHVSGDADINGDGFSDLLIGARFAPDGNGTGLTYVVFGSASVGGTGAFDLSTLDGDNGFVIDVSSDATLGDVNGDDLADIVIGAPGLGLNGAQSGGAYVIFGRSGGFPASFELSSLDGANGFVIAGRVAGELAGYSVSVADDVNGDGIDDIVLGAPRTEGVPGAGYVVLGRATLGASGRVNLSSLNGTNGFRLEGAAPDDFAGLSVSGAGDVNADGFGDLIIGAPGGGPQEPSPGASYVVFGKATTASGPSCSATANPSLLSVPNHGMTSIAASVNVRNAGGATFELVSVRSNEAGSGLGGGDVAGDIQGWATGTADVGGSLRAERGPNGTGRIYTLTYRVKGTTATSAQCETTVAVPNDPGLHVTIDIVPSDPSNVVRPTSNDRVRVAVLSSISPPFDPLQVNPESLRFGPSSAHSLYELTRDVNGDGALDLVATFAMPATGIGCGDVRAGMTGRTHAGARVFDSDPIRTTGCQ
jgi:hypothetical protein